MSALLKSYIENLQRTRDVLRQFLEKLRGQSLSPDSLYELKRLSHKLAGSAGTYGFEDLGAAALRLETKIEAALHEPDDIAIMAALSILLEEIDSIQASDTVSKMTDGQTNFQNTDIETRPKQSPIRPKVLVVDDDPHIGAYIESLLADSVDVISLSDASDIFAVIGSYSPDLILLDDDLAGVTGVLVVEQMQADENLRNIPVIMLTGNRDPRNVMRAVNAGAVDYYTKPFEPLSFAASIRAVLTRMKYTVMIIDDDQTIHEILRAGFRMNGLQVTSAVNGRDALALLQQGQIPDLIILDRMMPGLEGGAVLHNLQKDKELQKIPVIMLTARNAQGDAHSWMRRGVADFMEKPFNPEEVILRTLRLLDVDETN